MLLDVPLCPQALSTHGSEAPLGQWLQCCPYREGLSLPPTSARDPCLVHAPLLLVCLGLDPSLARPSYRLPLVTLPARVTQQQGWLGLHCLP